MTNWAPREIRHSINRIPIDVCLTLSRALNIAVLNTDNGKLSTMRTSNQIFVCISCVCAEGGGSFICINKIIVVVWWAILLLLSCCCSVANCCNDSRFERLYGYVLCVCVYIWLKKGRQVRHRFQLTSNMTHCNGLYISTSITQYTYRTANIQTHTPAICDGGAHISCLFYFYVWYGCLISNFFSLRFSLCLLPIITINIIIIRNTRLNFSCFNLCSTNSVFNYFDAWAWILKKDREKSTSKVMQNKRANSLCRYWYDTNNTNCWWWWWIEQFRNFAQFIDWIRKVWCNLSRLDVYEVDYICLLTYVSCHTSAFHYICIHSIRQCNIQLSFDLSLLYSFVVVIRYIALISY